METRNIAILTRKATPFTKRDTNMAINAKTTTMPQGLEYFTFGVSSSSIISMLISAVITWSGFFAALSLAFYVAAIILRVPIHNA